MAARNAKCSISTILRKNRDCEVWSVCSGMYQILFGQLTSKQPGAISAFNRAMFLEEAVLEIEVCRSLWELRGKMGHVATILGDPGAVSRVGRKGATKVLKHRRKSPWVPTLTGPFPNSPVDAGSWLGTKNALYYCAQSANSISWVLFVSSYTTAID